MTKKVKRWSRDDVSFLLYNLNNGMPLAEIAGYLLRTVMQTWEKLAVGKTERCAYRVALSDAEALVADMTAGVDPFGDFGKD